MEGGFGGGEGESRLVLVLSLSPLSVYFDRYLQESSVKTDWTNRLSTNERMHEQTTNAKKNQICNIIIISHHTFLSFQSLSVYGFFSLSVSAAYIFLSGIFFTDRSIHHFSLPLSLCIFSLPLLPPFDYRLPTPIHTHGTPAEVVSVWTTNSSWSRARPPLLTSPHVPSPLDFLPKFLFLCFVFHYRKDILVTSLEVVPVVKINFLAEGYSGAFLPCLSPSPSTSTWSAIFGIWVPRKARRRTTRIYLRFYIWGSSSRFSSISLSHSRHLHFLFPIFCLLSSLSSGLSLPLSLCTKTPRLKTLRLQDS